MKISTLPGARLGGKDLPAGTVLDSSAGDIPPDLARRWVRLGIADPYIEEEGRDKNPGSKTGSKNPGKTRDRNPGRVPEQSKQTGETRDETEDRDETGQDE